jgi:hypothetical protein
LSGSNDTKPEMRLTSVPGVLTGPCTGARFGDVVVAGQALIWTEGLAFDRVQRRLLDVGARNIPAGREAGLLQDQWTGTVGDEAVTAADLQVSGALADVDAVMASKFCISRPAILR